jgi:hypothetical protein
VTLAAPAAEALAAAKAEATDWGTELTDETSDTGRLMLPVVAGLRHGRVLGQLVARSTTEGSLLSFAEESSSYALNRSAVAALVLSALGGILCVLWPMFPGLLPLAPAGAVLAIAGWLLVVARLRTSGPQDFLNAVAVRLGRST